MGGRLSKSAIAAAVVGQPSLSGQHKYHLFLATDPKQESFVFASSFLIRLAGTSFPTMAAVPSQNGCSSWPILLIPTRISGHFYSGLVFSRD